MKKQLKLFNHTGRICKKCNCGRKEKMKKIKVGAYKFCLGADGGSEKFLQTVLANLPKDKFDVDAYYTNAAPYLGSDWVHPDNNPENLEYLRKNGVNLFPVHVDNKDIRQPNHPWVGTNFYDIFDESKYDVLVTVRAGHRESPTCELTSKPIIEIVTLPNMADNQSNIFKSVHISEFQKQSWIQAGGNPAKATVIPLISETIKQSGEDLKTELKIPENDFVFGFHQREDDGIFSPISLEAYKNVMTDSTWFVIMGGSKLYSRFAEANGLKNFVQLPFSGDESVKDKFLATLDVYAHARKDGETFGLAIAEAMSYGLPILSHAAPAMGHVETIGDAGFVCKTIEEYSSYMKMLSEQHTNEFHNAYSSLARKAKERFDSEYSVKSMIKKFVTIFEAANKENEKDTMSDEDFWASV